MLNGANVYLSPVEQQVIITALKHAPIGKLIFSMKEELIEKIKGKPVSEYYLEKVKSK